MKRICFVIPTLAVGGTERRCPDIAKLGALGYAPRISLDAGLPSLIDWYTANADLRPATAAAAL